jgi:predicted DNA-binding transcriptional regulator AlpA
MKENNTDQQQGYCPSFAKLPDDGYVRLSQLVPSPIPVSQPTLWRMVKDGNFPAPYKLSERVTAWRVEDVRNWMKERQKM